MKFSLILSIILLVACSKNKDVVTQATSPVPVPGPAPAVEIRVKTQSNGTVVRSHTYDAQGKAIRVEGSDGSKKEYEYPAGQVIRKYYNTAGVYQYASIEELNADGYSKRSTYSNQPTWEILFSYNPDKTVAKQFMKSNAVIILDYFWSNGNLDSVRNSSQNGTWNYTTVRTYYTDKPNVLGNAAFGEEYWGKASKNLVKSEVIHLPDGSPGAGESNTYEYDNNGRVTKKTMTSSNGNIEIIQYTYH